MKIYLILPICNLILQLGACIGYAIAKNLGSSLYWFFAACLTTTVTFLLK